MKSIRGPSELSFCYKNLNFAQTVSNETVIITAIVTALSYYYNQLARSDLLASYY